MWANKVINCIIDVTALILEPVQIVSTFIFGWLVAITLGLFLLPINLIWMWLFMGPLIWLSWVWDKAPLLRIPAAVFGIPAAVVGDAYAGMVPSMSEKSRVTRLLVCRTWPFSRTLTSFAYGTATPTPELERVLSTLASRDPDVQEFLAKLANGRLPDNGHRWGLQPVFKG